MAAEVSSSSRGAGALLQSVAELISGLEAENQTLQQRMKIMEVEMGLITKWIANTAGVEVFNRSTDLYKILHPDDEESADIEKKLTPAEIEVEEPGVGAPDNQAVPGTKTLTIQLRRLENDPVNNAHLLRRQSTQASSGHRLKSLNSKRMTPAAGSSSRTTKTQKKKIHGIARGASLGPVSETQGPKLRSKNLAKTCRFCKKRYPDGFSLRIHEGVHTGERPFKCQFCERTFRSNGNRSSHLTTHTREKPYECSTCGRRFSQFSVCRIHQLRHHSTERKYKCRYCNSRFAIKVDRIRHERTHTGEKPYVCRFCGVRFNQSGNMWRHERRFHLQDESNADNNP